jgi:hypothetical protein
LFNYPSIGELVEHLLDDVLEFAAPGGRASTAAGETTPGDDRDEQLNELGEDELADLLKSKLADMDEAD